MLLLTSIVVPIGMLASWQIEERVSLYFALVLALQTCLVGTFTALNFFHWFIFWELGLIPAFFLVRLWGGSGSAKAAMQFLVYTMVGSVAMLLSFLASSSRRTLLTSRNSPTMGQNGTLMPAVVCETRLASADAGTCGAGHLLWRVSWFRREGSAVPFPHLAALDLRRSAQRHHDPVDRRDVEDGRLRFSSHPASHLLARRCRRC